MRHVGQPVIPTYMHAGRRRAAISMTIEMPALTTEPTGPERMDNVSMPRVAASADLFAIFSSMSSAVPSGGVGVGSGFERRFGSGGVCLGVGSGVGLGGGISGFGCGVGHGGVCLGVGSGVGLGGGINGFGCGVGSGSGGGGGTGARGGSGGGGGAGCDANEL